ncbi:MAG: UDP-N-acetylmuramoyl-L-alanine--D-glutamate ligase [Bryobacteraceae bacterium]|nr:UDP-N-acetylmuramoyl-L-alanine--D-glutamate ligase [Bryobacteraceae bacterium]
MHAVDGAKVLVVGMAKSGMAAAELLRSRGADVLTTDAKPMEGQPFPFQRQSPEVFEGRDLIVVSPGVPADLPELEAARRRGVRVIGEVELAGYFLKGPIIGITGSNGKTTTTALTGHVLKDCGVACQVGGNIGVPPTAMVSTSREGQWNVLELSSFQLETVFEFRAHVAVALNVTPNHLNRHRTFENYAAAKSRLFLNQRQGDFRVLNRDNETTRSYESIGQGGTVWFGKSPECQVRFDGAQVIVDGRPLLAADQLQIRGGHNVENAMAAVAAARLAGAPLDGIAAALATFKAVEHRLEYVATIRGVSFYNDSKATSVDAAEKAVATFAGGLWLILGGQDKGAPYTPLRAALQQKARGVLLIGEATAKIANDLAGAAPLYEAGTLDAAVRVAFDKANPGDTVLLAPACASFDQFASYEQRGQVFKSLVRALEN